MGDVFVGLGAAREEPRLSREPFRGSGLPALPGVLRHPRPSSPGEHGRTGAVYRSRPLPPPLVAVGLRVVPCGRIRPRHTGPWPNPSPRTCLPPAAAPRPPLEPRPRSRLRLRPVGCEAPGAPAEPQAVELGHGLVRLARLGVLPLPQHLPRRPRKRHSGMRSARDGLRVGTREQARGGHGRGGDADREPLRHLREGEAVARQLRPMLLRSAPVLSGFLDCDGRRADSSPGRR